MIPSPLAEHGDLPSYDLVPQFDHVWQLNNSLVDTPGPGKTQLDMGYWGNFSWQPDWAGRANQLALPDASSGLSRAYHADFGLANCDFTLFNVIYVNNNTTDAGMFQCVQYNNPTSEGWVTGVIGGKTGFHIYNNNAVEGTGWFYPVELNKFYYMAITFVQSSKTLRFYINGELVKEQVLSILPGNAVNDYMYLCSTDRGSCMAGIIKNKTIFPAQIKTLYDTWVYTSGNIYKRHCYAVETFDSSVRGRDVSESFKRAVFAQSTEEVFLILVTVEHDELPNPIRLVSNTENIVSRGETYFACPLLIELPTDSDDQSPVAKITMDNLDKVIIASLRSISDAPTVSLELIRASDPETLEAAFYDLTLKQVNYDYTKVEGSLTYENVMNEPWPAHTFTPSYFEGLF